LIFIDFFCSLLICIVYYCFIDWFLFLNDILINLLSILLFVDLFIDFIDFFIIFFIFVYGFICKKYLNLNS
jgi:hypothetical protein